MANIAAVGLGGGIRNGDLVLGEGDPVVDGRLPDVAPLRIGLRHRPVIADFATRFFSMGSCFAYHASTALTRLGFVAYHDVTVGNQFSTRSMVPLLQRWVEGRSYGVDDLYRYGNSDAYLSPFHKNLIARGPGAATTLLAEMEARDAAARAALAEANIVLITLGSATYLRLHGTGTTLAYSLSVPRTDYDQVTSSVSELRADLDELYRLFKQLVRGQFHFVLTVSPQRYNWPIQQRFSLPGAPSGAGSEDDLDPTTYSNLDKAKLRVAVDDFVQNHAGEPVEYFPSYDIVMDELRLQETFSNNHRDHLHVGYPSTPNYVINRFLLSHCTQPVIAALQDFRRGFLPFEGRLILDQSPAGRTRALAFVRTMREHRDRVGCHVLYEKVRAVLQNARTVAPGLLVPPITSLPGREHTTEHASPPSLPVRPIDDPGFAEIRRAHERLAAKVAVWSAANKRVVLYGAGRHTQMLLRFGLVAKANVVAIADDYPEEDAMLGIPLVAREQVNELRPDVIVISSVRFQERLRQQAAAMCETSSETYPIYPVDELAQIECNMAHYERARDRLHNRDATP